MSLNCTPKMVKMINIMLLYHGWRKQSNKSDRGGETVTFSLHMHFHFLYWIDKCFILSASFLKSSTLLPHPHSLLTTLLPTPQRRLAQSEPPEPPWPQPPTHHYLDPHILLSCSLLQRCCLRPIPCSSLGPIACCLFNLLINAFSALILYCLSLLLERILHKGGYYV